MKKNISKKKLREFGLVIGLGFPIFVGLIIPIITGHGFRFWSLLVGCPLLILGILKPGFLFYPYRVWMKSGNVLGWINSRLILGLVYLIILLPIALLMKIIGYDPLRIKKNKVKSYRENKDSFKVNFKRIF